MQKTLVNKTVLILMVLSISAIFFAMIRPFLSGIFMAALFSALVYPFYRRIVRLYRGHKSLASITTLLLIFFFILLPSIGIFGIITSQAIKVSQSVGPWIQQQLSEPPSFSHLLETLPYYEEILPYRETIIEKAGQLVGTISKFLVNSLSQVTIMTVQLIFTIFVFMYTMYFFLIDGENLLEKILYYLPLEDQDERRLLDRFTSVTRATLKGTAVIGLLQGGTAGLAFAVVGIPAPAFWGLIMTVLSVIPALGTGIVWIPAGIILFASGYYVKSIGLLLFCSIIVGSIDNLLRPKLVGKDTEMHDLFIFFSTLGGLALFGIVGFIIGPIIAALFVTLWEIYGNVFRDILPEVKHVYPALRKNRPEKTIE